MYTETQRGDKGSAIPRAPNMSQKGGPNHCGERRSPNNVTSTFFNTVHLHPKYLSFKHGDAKLASCLGRHLTSLRPWMYPPECTPWDKEMYLRLGTPRLESDSARNNIHPNNKQKPKITNKNTGKITCQYGQLVWVWKVLRNLCRDFHLHVQVLWLMPLF